MKRLLLIILLTLLAPLTARANSNARGWCEDGAQLVITSGLNSTTQVQASFPQCVVTVLIHGGGAATIYSDNAATPTPLANPFTASTIGQWNFYVSNGRYDITLSGAGFPAPVTYSDVVVSDSTLFTALTQCVVVFTATPVFTTNVCSLFSMTLTGNVTSSTTQTPSTGQQAVFIICQDNAGSHTFAWPASFSSPPIINSVANSCTTGLFVYDGTVWRSIGVSGASSITSGTVGNIAQYSGATTLGDSGVATTNVPLLSTDNKFTSNERIKGPIPWRDFTAYMPAGGCSTSDSASPTTTGSITATTTTLTLTSAQGFKNGCGIAVIGAGP